jgi:hypothetical protein
MSVDRVFSTGSRRDSREGKGRFDLLVKDCPRALTLLAKHFEGGAAKYGDGNWTKGQPLSAYLDSGTRHAVMAAQGLTNEDHLVAWAWNAIAALETRERIAEGVLPETLADVFPLRVKPSEPAPVVESSGTFGDWGKASGCAPKSYPVAGFLTGSGIDWTKAVP